MFRKNWSRAGHGDTSLEDGRKEDQELKESLEQACAAWENLQ